MVSQVMPRPRYKLPKSMAAFLSPLILSGLVTAIVSAVSTARGIGFCPAFVSTWMCSWRMAWAIAFPCLLILIPVVRRFLAAIVED